MSDVAIALNGVSKCFQRYERPADRLKDLLLPGRSRANPFWALRDISLEIPRGQTLGVIGRNGSGKSTLLQIIVGTLMPSMGGVRTDGRISALLELGSGFDPEFTGRQNIFFNGQMLGLSRAELEARFDEIVAFADIGEFLERPVRTYSSGMFVRLAFAVAIHTQPDILIVDEALSVGDEAFQRKCYARIHAIRDAGGTILFVSHGASTIVELCDRAVLLDGGEMLLDGNPKLVVDKYQKLIYAPPNRIESLRDEIRRLNGAESTLFSHKELTIVESMASDPVQVTMGHTPRVKGGYKLRPSFDPDLKAPTTTTYESRGARISEPEITTLKGKPVNCLIGREEYLYTYKVTFERETTQVRFGMLIKTVSGLELGGASLEGRRLAIDRVPAGMVATVKFRFKCLLNPDAYFLNAGVSGTIDGTFGYLDRWIDAAMFKVQAEEFTWASGMVDLLVDPDATFYDGVSLDCEEVM